MSLEIVPLATATFTLQPPILVPETPAGTHVIIEVSDGRYVGERFNATQLGTASEWMTIGADGTARLDVRMSLQTDDGAMVFVQFRGITDMSGGPGRAPIYGASQYQTGDDRYAWLNKVQAATKGVVHGSHIEYEVYELR